MKNRTDLEQEILDCWHIIDDLDMTIEAINTVRNDKIINILSGLKDLIKQNGQLDSKTHEKFEKLKQLLRNKDNLFDYLAAICCIGYGIPVKASGRIQDMVEKTEHACRLAEKCKSTKEVLKMLDQEVYPVIEELFKEVYEEEEMVS